MESPIKPFSFNSKKFHHPGGPGLTGDAPITMEQQPMNIFNSHPTLESDLQPEFTNPIERLIRVSNTINQHADSETARWFNDGINHYLSSRDRPSLDNALGLASTGQGKPSERTRYNKWFRDKLIREAFSLINPDAKSTARCDALASEIRDFESRLWPKLMDLVEPPTNSSALRRLLFFAAKTGETLPSSWRSIYRIIYED